MPAIPGRVIGRTQPFVSHSAMDTLTLALYARGNRDLDSDIAYALVSLNRETAELYWQRMRALIEMNKSGPGPTRMIWVDDRPTWFTQPEDWWGYHRNEVFASFFDFVTAGPGGFYRGPLPDAEPVVIETATCQLFLSSGAMSWTALADSPREEEVYTGPIRREDLLKARIYLAPPAERAGPFADLVEYHLEVAIHVLANGLVLGPGFDPVLLSADIPQDVLLTALRSNNPSLRMETITALRNVRPVVATPSRRTR